MKYLKVWTDLRYNLKPFGDAEKGRLFDAMMEYAECGTEPDLRGNERFIWDTVKSEIDRQREAYDKKCEVNKVNITSRYEKLRKTTTGNDWKQEHKTKGKDNDREKKEKEKYNRPLARFIPPTVDEVKAYCFERQNGIDAQSFIDYYEANGWKQGAGRKPIVDWRACVRTWERNSNQTRAKPNNFDARSFLMGKEEYIDI